jgi:hypothetical protein
MTIDAAGERNGASRFAIPHSRDSRLRPRAQSAIVLTAGEPPAHRDPLKRVSKPLTDLLYLRGDLVRSRVAQPLLDDALWVRLEPLLPKPRRPCAAPRRTAAGLRARDAPASCLCCTAGCRGRCYRVKWDAAQAARAGDAWWSGNGPASGVACMRPSSPSCADGDGSTSAGRWWTAGRSARCAGGKNWTEPNRSPQGGVQTPHRDRCARVPLVAHVTAANVNDITHLDALVADLPAVRGRRGRPRRRPDVLQGDRGYDSQPHRDRLAARGIVAIFGRRRTSHGSGLGVFRWSSSARPPGSTGFVASPFAMNATTASILRCGHEWYPNRLFIPPCVIMPCASRLRRAQGAGRRHPD